MTFTTPPCKFEGIENLENRFAYFKEKAISTYHYYSAFMASVHAAEKLPHNIAFYAVSQKGIKFLWVLELVRLFDDHKDAISVNKLLRICEQSFTKKDSCYDEIRKAVRQLQNELNDLNAITHNLNVMRDKILAHNDKKSTTKTNFDKLIEDYPLKHEDGEKLTDYLMAVVNTLNLHLYGVGEMKINLPPYEWELSKIVDALNNSRQNVEDAKV